MKEYKIGDIYGYKIEIMESNFNPHYPGRAPKPIFPFDSVKTMMGKQTFYGLAIREILVEGLLNTKDETNIPVHLTWDGWIEFDECDIDEKNYEKAFTEGLLKLKRTFEKKEKQCLH